MHEKQTHRRSGFTLVELMVVIVIITILASLAFMGGRRILNKGREAAAINNLRQVSQGLFAIQADGGILGPHKLRGSFPGEGGYSKPGGVHYSWFSEVAESMGYGHYTTNTWGAKWVWTTDPNETAFHDPTADWELGTNGDTTSRGEDSFWQTSHFAYNIMLGAFVNPWGTSYSKGGGGYDNDKQHLMSQVRFPADLIYLSQAYGSKQRSAKEKSIAKDIGFSANNNGSLLVTPWKDSDGTPAIRVRGGANAVMSDGSVRWINTKKLYEGNWDSPHFNPLSKKPRKDIYQ
ncbi:type II secretion system protein [Haloferula chungangensis]|uniref:Type II secretion system protein n=1 Tax=Haloferula chungangensis TaxID=1048331 RepID=A0ABW2LC40_9BACT